MTRRQIEKLVYRWQRKLKLDHWEIEIKWSEAPTPGSYATTWRMNQYDRAEIYVSPEFTTWTADFAERTMVHELLHLVTRDLDRVLGDAEGFLPKTAFRWIDKRYEHEVEGVIDRLATVLVEVSS